MAGKIQAPEKELRFTRAGQAGVFWLSAAALAAAGITLLASSLYRHINPLVPHAAWALLPLALSAAMVRVASGMTRHAYLILTPLGIEIFPFIRPASGMKLILWQEIHAAEVNESITRITLHHDAAKTSGIHLSLHPIRRERRTLLAKAINGRLSTASTPDS
jgi:hypothetical protein